MAEKPQPPPDPELELDPPEGYRYVWMPDDSCRLTTEEEKQSRRCRRPGCMREVAIGLQRGFGQQQKWWLYCDWHMYGRRIVDGVVQWPRLTKDGE